MCWLQICKSQKVFKYPNWLIRQLDNWLKLKLSKEFSYLDIAMYFYVLITNMQKLSSL